MEVNKVVVTSGELVSEKVEVVWKIENFSSILKVKELRDRQKIHFTVGSEIGLPSEWMGYMAERKITVRTSKGKLRKINVCSISLLLKRVLAPIKELTASLAVKIKTVDSVTGEDNLDSVTNNSYGPIIVFKTSCCGMWYRRRGWWIWNSEKIPLVDGSLVIEAEVTVMKLKEDIPVPVPQQNIHQIEALFKPRFCEKLQQDFAMLLEGPHVQNEAKILSKDGVEFDVNRRILSARSPVFGNMFQKPVTETQTEVIAYLSSKTVAVLLQFLYTGTLHQDWSDEQVLPDLVIAANKYELQDLVDFLDQAAGHVCTKENARRLFSLLGKNGMKTGEKKVLGFLKRNNMSSSEDTIKSVNEGARQDADNNNEKCKSLKCGKEKKVSPTK